MKERKEYESNLECRFILEPYSSIICYCLRTLLSLICQPPLAEFTSSFATRQGSLRTRHQSLGPL